MVFDRHSVGFRAAGRVVSAALIGSGVRSIWNLADGGWHHCACRLDQHWAVIKSLSRTLHISYTKPLRKYTGLCTNDSTARG